jgi:hypothetical protein
MLPTSELLVDSLRRLLSVLLSIDFTLAQFIDERLQAQEPSNITSSSNLTIGRGGSSSDSASDVEGAAEQGALQLLSLVPHVAWSQLQALPYVQTDAVLGHCASGAKMVQLLLRAVCVLNAAGLLTERHSRGVVALLGGVPRCSSNNNNSSSTSDTNRSCIHQSSLLLQEPGDLQHKRVDAGISLADLSDALMLGSRLAHVTPLSDHLLQALGEDQLPAVAAYPETVPVSGTQQQASVDSATQQRWDSLKGLGIFDTYLSWAQETLLLVVSEVVSSQQPVACHMQGQSTNQKGS